MKYTISITQEEHEFLMSAVAFYADSLRNKLNQQRLISEIKKLDMSDAVPMSKAKKIAQRKSAEAPWGYKKDGTPKKRPGRAIKSKEATNEIQA